MKDSFENCEYFMIKSTKDLMRITSHDRSSEILSCNMKTRQSHYFLVRPRAFVLFFSIKPRCKNCVRFDNVVIGKGRGPRFWFRPFSVGLSTPLTSQGCWVQRLVSTLRTNLLVPHPSDGGQRKLPNNTILSHIRIELKTFIIIN